MDAERLHISSGYRKETIDKCKTAVAGSRKFAVVTGDKTCLPKPGPHETSESASAHQIRIVLKPPSSVV